ncbi:hypothetical protein BCR44DRAFT_1426950 [Catenaria anguillulae PL171]|uniref:Transmembrane protein n=1 Tax=Catenaria anguillulae PL171 TaxID=765915 RepID=A0A1Y2HYK1_9FUNG|nr:hypothetical protein BCR44DRAFT_1426950 [Catenaria anguillulae PL171]
MSTPMSISSPLKQHPAPALICQIALVLGTLLLPYPPESLILEFVIALAWYPLERFRLYYGSKGNLTESISSLILFLITSLIVPVTWLFFILWQTYVLQIDVWIHSISLTLAGIQLAGSLLVLVFLIRNRA